MVFTDEASYYEVYGLISPAGPFTLQHEQVDRWRLIDGPFNPSSSGIRCVRVGLLPMCPILP
jgi:hypothetical protein